MSGSTEPAGDAELLRLLDFYQQTRVDTYRFNASPLVSDKARERLLQYIAQHYVRRDAIYDEWDHLDTTAPLLPTPADVDAGKCRWTDHGWQWTDYRAARAALSERDPTTLWGGLAHLAWLLHHRLACQMERAARRRGRYGYPRGAADV